jgi:hypothetical protein
MSSSTLATTSLPYITTKLLTYQPEHTTHYNAFYGGKTLLCGVGELLLRIMHERSI